MGIGEVEKVSLFNIGNVDVKITLLSQNDSADTFSITLYSIMLLNGTTISRMYATSNILESIDEYHCTHGVTNFYKPKVPHPRFIG